MPGCSLLDRLSIRCGAFQVASPPIRQPPVRAEDLRWNETAWG